VSGLGLTAIAAGPGGQVEVLRLYPAGAPGSSAPPAPEASDGLRVRNVTDPTLTIFRPPAGKASDVSVLIVPGGGFQHLSIANEGYDVARQLVARGLTALVLKYRVSDRPAGSRPAGVDELNDSAAAQTAMQDGDRAMRLIRAHAGDWGLSPRHVGALGFSAGAVIVLHLALSADPDTRPDFAAALYGAMPGHAAVPAGAPPLFLAAAVDDQVMGIGPSQATFRAWHTAGADVELHFFRTGGHGFGMNPQHGTSDHWLEEYLWWLESRNLLRPQ